MTLLEPEDLLERRRPLVGYSLFEELRHRVLPAGVDLLGRPVARALRLYHGKSGAGLSIEMNVRLGPVTILGVTQTADGQLKLIAAEGELIAGPTFRIGNANSRIRFGSGPTAFFDAWCAEGPTHHVALGVGHEVSRLRKVADLLGLELAVVD